MTDQETSTPTPQGELEDALAAVAADDTFVCTRVWEAWGYGTMTADDFTPLAESPDTLSDMASDVILTLSAPAAIDRAAEGVTAYLRGLEPIYAPDAHEIARAAVLALLGVPGE